jgi:hypothetical protein
MSNKYAKPYFPVPPRTYDFTYFAELVRSFSVFIQQERNPGIIRGTELVLTNLPVNDYGLEEGTVFQRDGVLYVSVPYKPHPKGVFGTAVVGGVSVSVT